MLDIPARVDVPRVDGAHALFTHPGTGK